MRVRVRVKGLGLGLGLGIGLGLALVACADLGHQSVSGELFQRHIYAKSIPQIYARSRPDLHQIYARFTPDVCQISARSMLGWPCLRLPRAPWAPS